MEDLYRYIAKWMGGCIEQITRDSQDRASWRELVRGAAHAADYHY